MRALVTSKVKVKLGGEVVPKGKCRRREMGKKPQGPGGDRLPGCGL